MKYLIFLSFILLGCNPGTSQNRHTLSTSEIRAQLEANPKTILFIWTSWCGISADILKNTYINQRDSFALYDIKVLLICGSAGQDSIINYLNDSLKIPAFYLTKSNSSFPYFNRSNIKKSLAEVFGKKLDKNLTKGNFGIPISLIVDSNLNILYDKAPQDFSSLKNFY